MFGELSESRGCVRKANWKKYILAFTVWLIVSALSFWILVVFRQALLSLLSTFYVGDSAPRSWRAGLVDRVYILVAGLIYLIFILLMQEYLRVGVTKDDVLRRFARVVGIELLVLLPIDLTTSLLQRSFADPVGILLFVVEIFGGGALLAYSIRAKHNREALPSQKP